MTMRGHARPNDEPGRPAKLDGQSMAYQLNSLGISVLALLRARPMHGYEMYQTLVERHADRIVKVRPGSLYHVVDRLTEEKLIRRAATARDGKRPERAIYEITDAGAEALADRVGQLIAVPAYEFPQFAVVSGRWRPRPPRSWRFAMPASHPPDICWHSSTCWRRRRPSCPGCEALPTRCDPAVRSGG
jgi:DNA-binding PadR family transcriptional regulator